MLPCCFLLNFIMKILESLPRIGCRVRRVCANRERRGRSTVKPEEPPEPGCKKHPEKIHMRTRLMGAESYTADTAKAVPVSNLSTAHNVKSRATFCRLGALEKFRFAPPPTRGREVYLADERFKSPFRKGPKRR